MLYAFAAVFVFIVASVLFVLVTMMISSILRPARPGREKAVAYECGEEALGGRWVQFNIRFYVFAVIFIVFDVEVIFIYPIAVAFRKMVGEGLGVFVLAELLVFVLILLGGLAYVWLKDDLKWE